MSDRKLRDVLFTPWRNAYIKKALEIINPEKCVFCDAVEKGVGLESLMIYRGKNASVILNKFPYNNGHTMVIPNGHLSDYANIDGETFKEMHELLQKTVAAMKDAYKPGGFNIGMNMGRTGGAGIANHLHYHVVPRWDGDSNFMPLTAGTKVVSESLEVTFNKLVPYFKS